MSVSPNRFGHGAYQIVKYAAEVGPVNPYDWHKNRHGGVQWSYAYAKFERLVKAGLLERCETPEGHRGNWYTATEAGRKWVSK